MLYTRPRYKFLSQDARSLRVGTRSHARNASIRRAFNSSRKTGRLARGNCWRKSKFTRHVIENPRKKRVVRPQRRHASGKRTFPSVHAARLVLITQRIVNGTTRPRSSIASRPRSNRCAGQHQSPLPSSSGAQHTRSRNNSDPIKEKKCDGRTDGKRRGENRSRWKRLST